MKPLKHLPAWKALEAHFKTMRSFDMRAAVVRHFVALSSSANSWRRRSAPN